MMAIDELFKSEKVTPVTVWLDGMISEATAIHTSHPNYLNKDLRGKMLRGEPRIHLTQSGSGKSSPEIRESPFF